MTVINVAHNKDTVALVADSQLSSFIRKSMNGDKIYFDNFPGMISGVTGNSIFFIDEAIGKIEFPPEPPLDPGTLSGAIHYRLRDLKNQKIDSDLISAYNLTIEDLVRGQKKDDKIDETLLKNLQQELENKNGRWKQYLDNSVTTIGFDGKNPEIYYADPFTRDKISLNFYSSGSGSDLASQSLQNFYETIKDPNSLKTTKMVKELVRAKIRSEKNIGVGGTSNIAYSKRDSKPVILGKNESVLFEEIIKGEENGNIGIRASNKSLDDLINGATFYEVEPRVIGDNRELDLHLRGYRV